MTILLTGAAGFIGLHTALRLLERGETVIGVDNLSPYYDPELKKDRLKQLADHPRFGFYEIELSRRDSLWAVLMAHETIDRVIHLAAQPGVRHSLTHPFDYIQANISGQLVVLEACRNHPGLRHLVYASSSSVYGGNTKLPFSVGDRTDAPLSLYGATKKADELFGHSYAHLYGIPMTGLRFFTVYGPWGRPDMAPMIFARKIVAGEPIPVFNHGKMQRDFTYVDDIVSGVIAALDNPPDSKDGVPHRVFNLGNHRSEPLMDFIEVLGQALGREPVLDLQPMQPGDVLATYADIEESEKVLGYRPTTAITEGVPKFVDWYRDYFKV